MAIVAGELEKKIEKYRDMEHEFKYTAYSTIYDRHFDQWCKKNGLDPDESTLTATEYKKWQEEESRENPS